ncbi:hypothetical protein NLJ89_g11606 [Agrocybe chaxingu]|uniref:Fungal-type protein kinase domain-containing protein n=1 Tax=Agrocybe chaxingu TaxID=84603 RepID=A0A9W8MPV2_9AGAR|nr:hypothetical protein NLJ89_g11606 [Agrocybe chaxingu]
MQEPQPLQQLLSSAEFKKKTSFEAMHDVHNCLKIVTAANHVMNDDPWCMFTYGITIEDKDISLWYFSRSHSTKSHHFGFMTDVKTFISLLLSFIFVMETEIGYDSTIYCVKTPSPVSYVYQINERFFKTPNAHLMVLKDVWLDATALTEKEIQAVFFSDLEVFGQAMKSKDPQQFAGFTAETKDEIRCCLKGKAYKKYFLSIECDCQGHTSRAVLASAYPVDGLFSVGIPSSQVSSQQSQVSGADPS